MRFFRGYMCYTADRQENSLETQTNILLWKARHFLWKTGKFSIPVAIRSDLWYTDGRLQKRGTVMELYTGLETGRPADTAGRADKEIRVYDLLD